MSSILVKRGTTAKLSTYVGEKEELTMDTDKNILVLQDGVTPGGNPADVVNMLSVGELRGLSVNSNAILIPAGHSLDTPAVSTDSLKGRASASNIVTVPTGHYLKADKGALQVPGTVVQVVTVRYDTQSVLSIPASTTPTILTGLNLTITPKYSTSLLLMQWHIHGEGNENTCFVICKGGALITTTPVGYNSVSGNVGGSCISNGVYDQNTDSTPFTFPVNYSATAGATTAMTFAPGVRNGAAASFSVNRALSYTPSTGYYYEAGVSSGWIMEIAV